METFITWLAMTPFPNPMKLFKKTRTATLTSVGINVTITVEGPDEQTKEILEIFESFQGPLKEVQLANVVLPSKTSSRKKGCCGGNGS